MSVLTEGCRHPRAATSHEGTWARTVRPPDADTAPHGEEPTYGAEAAALLRDRVLASLSR